MLSNIVIIYFLDLQLINKSEGKYTSWSCRFINRFRAFHSIPSPNPLRYDDFLNQIYGINYNQNESLSNNCNLHQDPVESIGLAFAAPAYVPIHPVVFNLLKYILKVTSA